MELRVCDRCKLIKHRDDVTLVAFNKELCNNCKWIFEKLFKDFMRKKPKFNKKKLYYYRIK